MIDEPGRQPPLTREILRILSNEQLRNIAGDLSTAAVPQSGSARELPRPGEAILQRTSEPARQRRVIGWPQRGGNGRT